MMMAPAHLSNSHHDTNMENRAQVKTDLVCGRSLNAEKESYSYLYNGTIYYFHSNECMSKFKEAPEGYINQPLADHAKHSHNGLMWGMGGVVMAVMMVVMIL